MRRLGWPGRPEVLAIAIAAVIVLASAILSVATWASGGSSRPLASPAPKASAAATAPPGAPGPGRPPASPPQAGQERGQLVTGTGHVAALPASVLPGGGTARQVVTLVIVSGAPSVTVTAAPLGGTLVRAVTAGGYGARPVLSAVQGPGTGGGQATTIGVSLAPAGAAAGPAGHAALALTVSAAVAWQLDFGGGTTSTSVNMAGGHVAGLAFGMGSASVQVALPRLEGTVTLRLEGGASQLSVSAPAGVPARVTAGDGAARVTLGAAAWSGVAPGTVLAQPGWAAAAGRLDIDAASGVSQVTVADR
jgi:hypothetical protein